MSLHQISRIQRRHKTCLMKGEYGMFQEYHVLMRLGPTLLTATSMRRKPTESGSLRGLPIVAPWNLEQRSWKLLDIDQGST
jgi:hypothetical protein